MSDTIHLCDISQSTLAYFKFILYFNSHFYTSIVIVTYEPLPFLPVNKANTHIMAITKKAKKLEATCSTNCYHVIHKIIIKMIQYVSRHQQPTLSCSHSPVKPEWGGHEDSKLHHCFQTFQISSLTFSLDSNCELNSHADTCVLVKNAYIFLDYDRAVDIIGYVRSKGTSAKKMKTISSALVYDDHTTGKMTIIVVHQAIHVPTMESNLLIPVQVWMNDVKVDETPKCLT